jgi:aminobenzoyl-glutamate utilization protein B
MDVMDAPYASVAEAAWTAIAPTVRGVARWLWEHPELGLMERESAARLRDWLTGEGFAVRDSASTLPNAFVAERGSGSPAVGILLEFDALPGRSNVAEPRREPVGSLDSPGHACGHNLIGAVNAGAGIAAANALAEIGAAGRIVLYGTPAEELLLGKLAMLDAADFDDVDVVLTHHPSLATAAISRPCLAVVSGEVGFRGAPAHPGLAVPRNPLDAVELSVSIVERLRAHHFGDTSIEHVQRTPVTSIPNAGPEEARCWWYVRHVDHARAEACYRWILEVSEAAARLCRVDIAHTVLASCRGYLPNDVVGRVLFEELDSVGSPDWNDDQLAAMARFGAAFDAETPFGLHRGVELLDSGVDRYSQDDGDLSHLVPLGRYTWAVPSTVPIHSWAATAFFGTDLAWRGAEPIGRAMTRSAVRLVTEPEVVAEAKDELRRRVPDPLSPSLRGAWDRLPAQAAAFWRGDWNLGGTSGDHGS